MIAGVVSLRGIMDDRISRRDFFLSLLAAGMAAGLPLPGDGRFQGLPVPMTFEYDAYHDEWVILGQWFETNVDSRPEMHYGLDNVK